MANQTRSRTSHDSTWRSESRVSRRGNGDGDIDPAIPTSAGAMPKARPQRLFNTLFKSCAEPGSQHRRSAENQAASIGAGWLSRPRSHSAGLVTPTSTQEGGIFGVTTSLQSAIYRDFLLACSAWTAVSVPVMWPSGFISDRTKAILPFLPMTNEVRFDRPISGSFTS